MKHTGIIDPSLKSNESSSQSETVEAVLHRDPQGPNPGIRLQENKYLQYPQIADIETDDIFSYVK